MKFSVPVVFLCLMTLPHLVFAQEVENFTLTAVSADLSKQSDRKFELKDHKGKVVVLHFLLKTECPFCLKYTNQFAQLAATTPDVIHLFIKPDSEKDIQAWVKKVAKLKGNKQPIIYRDPDAKLATEFGVPDGYQFHGQSVHYPALIALDGDGKELFRYVGKNNSDRMTTEAFVEKLQALHNSTQ